MSTFDSLAESFDRGRLGYANEIYDNLVNAGVKQRHTVLDVGCGTGLSSAPLIHNGFNVLGLDESDRMLAYAKQKFTQAKWAVGNAEKIPLPDASVDAVICAQAFHFLDRDAALKEAHRVLKPGGVLSVWWKQLSAEDAIKLLRDSLYLDLGFDNGQRRNFRGLPVLSEGLTGGFKELYGGPFRDQSIKVIPWRTTTLLGKYMQYERSRAEVREWGGERVEEYFAQLEQRLRDRFGAMDAIIPLGFTHFQYLAIKK